MLIIFVSAAMIITHFFSSFFWLLILLGITMGGLHAKIAKNHLIIITCLVSIFVFIHHIYLGLFCFWSGVWNFNNVITDQH